MAPGPVWTGAENLASTGIRSLDRPARSSVDIPTELLLILINPLDTKLNPICHLLKLLESHHIFHGSRIRVNLCKMFCVHSRVLHSGSALAVPDVRPAVALRPHFMFIRA